MQGKYDFGRIQGKGRCARGCRTGVCATLQRGNEPPISLCLDKEKRAVHGPKRNRLGAKPAPQAPFCAKQGSCETARRKLEGLCRVRPSLVEQRSCFPAFVDTMRLSGWSSDLAPSGPARSASLRTTRSIPGGKSKGEGPQSLPFESLGGVGETGEAPPAADEASLFRGSGAIGGPKGAANRNTATVLKSKRPHVSGGGRRGRGLCAKDLSPSSPAPCQDALCMIRSSARFSPSPTRANTAAGQPRARRPTALCRPLLAKEPSAMPMLPATDSVEAQRPEA